MAQPREEVMNGLDDEHSPVAVLNIGGMDLGADEQAGGIGDDGAFAAFDLLAGIVSARAATGGLDRLAVDHAGRWACLATRRLSRFEQQFEVDAFQNAVVAPRVK